MSEQLKESLSAVMDGEADEFEIRRVLDEATSDAELRGVWERYHLIGSVLRGEGRTPSASSVTRGLSAPDSRSFWARIDADGDNPDDVEAMLVDSEPAPANRWMQRIVGVAVAAGVAAAVVIGLGHNGQSTLTDDGLNGGKVATVEPYTTANVPVAMVDDSQVPVPATTQPTAMDIQRLHAYMLHHARQVALTNQARAVPFVKVAAFESQ